MTLIQETVEAIFDNYADAIEGGTGYRGTGTSYKGIPGSQTHDLDASAVSIVTDAASNSSTIGWTGAADYPLRRFDSTNLPPWFALCTTATQADNVGAARKILTQGTASLSVDPFPAAVTNPGDVFSLRQGFKRAPDDYDILADDEDDQSHDRFFTLGALAGSRLPWSGNGTETHKAKLELRVRFVRHSRSRKEREAIFANMLRLRSIMVRGSHRGDFVQVLDAGSDQPVIESGTQRRFVLLDRFDMVYRVNSKFL